jgi:hypothetical protein
MAVALIDIPVIILERIEAAHPGPALFSATEIDDWPEPSLHHLCVCGILQPVQRATAIICPGCSWQCHKPVVLRNGGAGVGGRAFIVCDEEPDHGRQPIDLRYLDQYRTTIARVCAFLAAQIGLEPARSAASGAPLLLGTIKGRHGSRQARVGFRAGRVALEVGQHSVEVARVLRWSAHGLALEVDHVRRLANRKERHLPRPPSQRPDPNPQQERSQQTQARNEAIFRDARKMRDASGCSWTAIAQQIAAGLPKGGRRRVGAPTVRRIITEMLRIEREDARSIRKARR